MPEGPEVHTIAQEIREYLEGKFITNLLFADVKEENSTKIGWRKWIKQKDSLEQITFPCEITDVSAYGKKLLFYVTGVNGTKGTIVTGLGMTGQWTKTPSEHARIGFELKCGECNGKEDTNKENKEEGEILYFKDTRRFGSIIYYENWSPELFDIGPCLLTNPPSLDEYIATINSYSCQHHQIVQLMMDQSVYSGIGNYLKSEILYRCLIAPYCLISELTEDEIKELYKQTLAVINESFIAGGLTIKDYWSFLGNRGMYIPRVYGLEVTNKGETVVHVTLKDKRVTHWVPEVQK